MDSLVSLFALSSALLFQFRILNVRRLQERGVSALTALYYQRYALIPAALLLLLTFRTEHLFFLAAHPLLVLAIVLQMVFWVVVEYLSFFVLGSVNTLSFLNAFTAIIALPVYLLIGVILNGDVPNFLIVLALMTIGVAIYLKPAQHKNNKRKLFSHGLLFIVFFTFLGIFLDGMNTALYRFVLQNFHATLFVIALSMFTIMLVVWVFFLFKDVPENEKRIAQDNRKWAYAIAPLWFLASIPEGYAFSAMPIYTVVAIGSIRFFMDLASDLRNERVEWNARTLTFVVLVLAGISLSILSLR